ncbi:MAG: FAD-dependent oxidoreductase, partial [Prevotella shahii]|nr:FAD-dependent oxidoreductase [Hoylesella shahii]
MNNNDIIIIGGGLGGLTTGALLAKEGRKVTVLEKNNIVGGGLQNFTRKGILFDTGMHMLGGFRPGQTLYRICQHLGIMQKLKLKRVD